MSRLKTRLHNGYRQFKDPKTGRWIFVHRRVAEKKIGGTIYPGWHVHLMNHDKLDNRPENLVILPPDQHRKVHRLDREMIKHEYVLDTTRSKRKAEKAMTELYKKERELYFIENGYRFKK